MTDLSGLALSPFLHSHVFAVVKVWEGGGSLVQAHSAVQSPSAHLEGRVVLWRLVASSRGGVEALGAVFPAAHHAGLKGESRIRRTRSPPHDNQVDSPAKVTSCSQGSGAERPLAQIPARKKKGAEVKVSA